MAHERTANRRKWSRETVQLPVQYFIKGESTRCKEGTIINLSRSGVGVLFPLNEPLTRGVRVFLELCILKTPEQLSLKGEVKTRHKRGDSLIGGIHFISLLPEDLFIELEHLILYYSRKPDTFVVSSSNHERHALMALHRSALRLAQGEWMQTL